MEIMDNKAKRKYAILNFIPAVAFLIAGVYYLFTLGPLIQEQALQDHETIHTITANHYDTLFIMLAISAVLSAVTLIYDIIHLTRIKNMNGGTKIMWIVALGALVPISFILFYFLEIRNEPKHLETYPDIA